MKNLSESIKNISIFPGFPRMVHCSSGWNGRRTPVSNYFYYVLEGSFVLQVEGKTYFVQKNQLALLPQGKQHSFWISHAQNMSMLDFAYKIECNGEDFFSYFHCNEDDLVIDFPREEIQRLFDVTRVPTPKEQTALLYARICNVLSELSIRYVELRMLKEQAGILFGDVVQYMHEHLDQHITLNDLAGLTGYEPTYFSAKFKHSTGISPMKYLADLRINKAAQLLQNTGLTNKEIAAAVGFDSVYYFSNSFKNQMGLSPDKYKAALAAMPETFNP